MDISDSTLSSDGYLLSEEAKNNDGIHRQLVLLVDERGREKIDASEKRGFAGKCLFSRREV